MTKEERETREKLKLRNIAIDWLGTEHPEGNIQSLVNLILSFTEPIEKRITELEKVNAELNKLRCCENCKNVNLQLHWKESKEIDEMRQFVCGTCGNRKHWEYLGKTVGITEMQHLTKATEIIKELLDNYKYVIRFREYANKKPIADAEQFLKEIEK